MWNAIKAAAKAAFKVISNAPVGGILKVGLLIGSAVFAAWVLIARAKKMHNASEQGSEEFYSPVDEILGKKNYVNSVEDFDDMDPLAREICDKMNKLKKKKRKKRKGVRVNKKKLHDIFDVDTRTIKRRPKESDENFRTVSLFDDDDDFEFEFDLPQQPPKNTIGGMDAATDMLNRSDDEKRRRQAKARAAKRARESRENPASKKRKKIPVLDDDGLKEVARALKMWHKYGDEKKEEIMARLDKIAKDLGLNSFYDLDAVVSESVRAQHPNLF